MKKTLKTMLLVMLAGIIGMSFWACKKDGGGSSEQPIASYLTLSHTEATVEIGKSVTITPTSDLSLENLIWRSEDDAIASVQNGVITGVSQGRVKIFAEIGELNAYCTVNVTAGADLSQLRLVLDTQKKYLTVGESFILKADLYNNETPLSYEVDCAENAEYFTVSRIGTTNTFTITAVKAGVVNIIAKYEHLSATANLVIKNANAVSLPSPTISVDSSDGKSLKFSVDTQYADHIFGYEVKASLGQYGASVNKGEKYVLPQSLLSGNGVEAIKFFVKSTASDDDTDYISGDYAECELIIVQSDADEVVYEKEFLKVEDAKLYYNENIVGAELIAEKDGAEITVPASGTALESLGDFDTLSFFGKKGSEKIAYLGGYSKYTVTPTFYSDINKTDNWGGRVSASFDFDKGAVINFRVPGTNTNRHFPIIELTVNRDLANLVSFSYDITLSPDLTEGTAPVESDSLYFLPNLPGSAQTRSADNYALTSAIISGKSGISIADGWQTVTLDGLKGYSTKKGNFNSVIDNGDGTSTLRLTFINRWNVAVGSSPKNFNITISNLQFAISQEEIYGTALYSGRSGSATRWSSRESSYYDNEKGTVYNFRLPNGSTNAQPMIEFTTTQDLSRLTGLTYGVKITSDTTVTSDLPTSEDKLFFLPNVASSDQTRADFMALTSKLIPDIVGGITTDNGWKTVTITGLKGLNTSKTYGSETFNPIRNNADGTWTVRFVMINRWNAESGGSIKNFNLSISNLCFTLADDPIPEIYTAIAYSDKSSPWNSRVSISDDAEQGKVYNFRLPSGYPYSTIEFTTKRNLTGMIGLSYDIKVSADTVDSGNSITESDSLYFLPNLPGSAQTRSADNYALTSDIISGKSGISIADGWQTVTLSGLSGVNTKKGDFNSVIDNKDGTFTLKFVLIDRWNAASGSGASAKNFNLSISDLQFDFA